MRKPRFLTLLLGTALVSASAFGREPTPTAAVNGVPPLLLQELNSQYRGMRLIDVQDISTEDCDLTKKSHPGWISADFTGSGRQDFAALLLNTKTDSETVFNGKTYTEHKFSLVAFLSKGSGKFEAVTLTTFIDNIPTVKGLQIQPTGKVFDLDAAKWIQVSHPAIAFYSCGQFEVVYRWAGSRFEDVVVSR